MKCRLTNFFICYQRTSGFQSKTQAPVPFYGDQEARMCIMHL